MKGVVPLKVLGIVAVTAATLISLKILFCSLSNLLNSYVFDIPSCRECAKIAYPYGGAYAHYVGKAWKAVNDLRKLRDDLRSTCHADLFDENGNVLPGITKSFSHVALSVKMALHRIVDSTNAANSYLVIELSSLYNELNEAGAPEVNDAHWLSLYADVRSAVEDLSDGGQRTEIGKIMAEMEDKDHGGFLERVVFPAMLSVASMNPLGVVVMRPLSTLYDVITLGDIATFFNLSVGQHRSLLTEMKKYRERFDVYKEETDRKVKKMEREMKEALKFFDERVKPLRDVNLSTLASFLPPETVVGVLRAPMGKTPSLILSLASQYGSQFEDASIDYASNVRFLSAYERMRQAHASILSLKEETERFLSILKRSIGACVKYAKSYDFASDELQAKAVLYILTVDPNDPVTSAENCGEIVNLIETDKKLKGPKAAWEKCREEYLRWWGEEPACSGDYLEMYSCCKNLFDQRRSAYLSSPEYLRYKELYDTLEELALSNGLVDLLSRLYSLPREPLPSELEKYYARLLALLDTFKKKLSSSITIRWEGFLSAESVSDVTLHLSNPLPIPLAGKVSIPFEYVGYRVEANGMLITVSGSKLTYNGRGDATIAFQALPVDLEETVLYGRDGYVLVHLLNPYPLPVEVYTSGVPIAQKIGVDFHEGHLYLSPGASVTIQVRALTVERNQVDDTAYFILRNDSPYPYKGIVTLDVNASSGPSYCVIDFGKALCKVNLSPGEEKIIKFKGYLLPQSSVSFAPPEPAGTVSSTVTQSVAPTVEKTSSTAERFNELLDHLHSYWERARELGVVDLLPFDEGTLKNLEGIDPTLRDDALPLLTRLDNRVKREAEARTKVLETLAEKTDDPKLESMAKMARQSLLTGDYVLPLALGRDVEKYLTADDPKETADLMPLLLVVIALVAGFSYFLKKASKKKRRIPRF